MLPLPENQIGKYVERHHQKLEEVAALNKLGLANNHPEVQAPSSQAKLALKDAFREASSLKEALKLENEIRLRKLFSVKRFKDFSEGFGWFWMLG